MSDELILQLNAIETKFQKHGRALQSLVNKNKNKSKHYAELIQEAGFRILYDITYTLYICDIYIYYTI